MILVLHIPKTGGNSLHRVLLDHYGQGAVYRDSGIPPRIPPGTQAVIGHFSYGLHQHIAQPCEYVVMLREPVERLLSYYAMELRARVEDWPGRYAQFWAGGKPMPFIDFARNKIHIPHDLDNGMTRQLAGADWYHNPQPVTNRAYQQAVNNLNQCQVGLTERFNESMARFAQRYGWQYTRIVQAGKSSHRPRITIGERRIVERFQHWDMKLYQEAVRVFDEQS